MENRYILEISQVNKSFGKFAALKNVSFNVTKGRIVGLLGKNGAGKTTLIKTILGLLKKYDGEIRYDGQLIDTNNPVIMSTIGSLVDTSFHEDLTAYDNLKLLMMASPVKVFDDYHTAIYKLLELVDLHKNAKNKVKSFSFGMKQRLALAQALMVNPKLLILDEPFVGLDPLGIEIVKNKLTALCREQNVSIIFSSHQLTEVAEISDDIVILSGGEVGYSGNYSQLVNNTKKYHIYLKTEVGETLFINSKNLICEGRKEIIVRHSDSILDETLKSIASANLVIENITIEENALLGLFDN